MTLAGAGVADFDLTNTGTTLYSKLPTIRGDGSHPGGAGAQGFAFDDLNHRMYVASCIDAVPGHIWLGYYDISKNPPVPSAQYMTLNNFGHGQQVALEYDGTNVPWIWIETDAKLSSNGISYGSKIGRFKFQPGLTLDGHVRDNMTTYDLVPGSTGNNCSIDNRTGKMQFCYIDPKDSATRIAIYNLSDIATYGNAAQPISAPVVAAWHSGTFQGRCFSGDYNYGTTGAGKSPICATAPEAWLGWQNVWSGTQWWTPNNTARSIPRRESEGIAIQTLPDGSRRLVWSFTTKKDCTGSGPYLQSWYYIAESQLFDPQAVEVTSNAYGGPLGCGSYRVYAYDRGAQDLIGEITPLSSVQWGRVRDDISNAVVQTVGFGQDCCQMLEGLRSMRHELVIFRDGVRVWEGPITRISYQADHVEIEARDVMQWISRRIIRNPFDHSYKAGPIDKTTKKPKWIRNPHGQAAVLTVKKILHDVLTPSHTEITTDDPHEPEEFTYGYDPNISQYIVIYPHWRYDSKVKDARDSRHVLPFQQTAWEVIDDMASSGGIDYTTYGRRIVVWDTSYAIGKTITLSDDDFMANPIVTEYGMSLATLAAVTDGQGYYGIAGGSSAYYGLIEALDSSYTSSGAPDKTSLPSYKAINKARATYVQRYHEYHEYDCLSPKEASHLAAMQRERNQKGIKPERQKTLDAAIKPLMKRLGGCAAAKSRMDKAHKAYTDLVGKHSKYEKQIKNYLDSLDSQAARNLRARNTMVPNPAGKGLVASAPVTVRIPDNTQLNPAVMLGIQDLIPGIWIPLHSANTCRKITQWQKLDSVNVTWSVDSGPEQVAVTMSPAPQGGRDPDANPLPDVDDGT